MDSKHSGVQTTTQESLRDSWHLTSAGLEAQRSLIPSILQSSLDEEVFVPDDPGTSLSSADFAHHLQTVS